MTPFRICIFIKGDSYAHISFALLQSINSLYGKDVKITILHVDISKSLIDEIKIKMPHAKLIEGGEATFNSKYTMSGKMQYWADLIKDSEEENIALLDGDTILVKDISPIFDEEFDIGFTYKTESNDDRPEWPINGGVLFIKKSDRVIKFFDKWTEITLDYITGSKERYKKLCDNWGAVDQAALGILLGVSSGDRRRYQYPIYKYHTVFVGFPCKYYNELKNDPDPEARIYHYKNRWHHRLIKDSISPSAGEKFKLWQQHKWDWSEAESPLSISVIMSVYNQEKYIREAISSILNQTFTDFELIIIDDASTDSTSAIIKSFNDSRIKIITNRKNTGLTKSLNKGIKIARGKCIARLDADDRAHYNRFEIQYNYLKSHPSTALCGTMANIINENGLVTSISIAPTPQAELLKRLLWDNCLIHSSSMYRKKYITEIGGYNEEYKRAQDYALWIEFFKKYKITCLKDVLVDWRSHKKGISKAHHSEQADCAGRISLSFLRYTFPELDGISDGHLLLFRKEHMHFFLSDRGPIKKDKILEEIQARLR
jgi:glycosyltransferase involved in cell wall biosynthesis